MTIDQLLGTAIGEHSLLYAQCINAFTQFRTNEELIWFRSQSHFDLEFVRWVVYLKVEVLQHHTQTQQCFLPRKAAADTGSLTGTERLTIKLIFSNLGQ